MFPSLFNIILCGILITGLYVENFLNQVAFLSILIAILLFNTISFFAALIRAKNTSKKLAILKEILKSLGANSNNLDLNNNLKLVVDEIGKVKQKMISSQTHSEYLQNCLIKVAKSFRNISKTLSFSNEKNLDNIRELIEKYNEENIKNIYSLTKVAIPYETHYDDFNGDLNPSFNGANVAILNDDCLENFLLETILKQYEINVKIFNNISDFSSFACVIADEKYDITTKNVIFLSDTYNKDGFLKRPFDKIRLKKALENILSEYKVDVSLKEYKNDVLVFLDNDIQSNYIFHIANAHAKLNKKVDSISAFKKELDENYKIIIIGYTAMLYDYETLKSKINSIKNTKPNTFVILFVGEKHVKTNTDFADLIIKDATQSQIIEVIKKHT